MVTWVRRGHGGTKKKVLQCLSRTRQSLLQDLPCLHEEEYLDATSKGQQEIHLRINFRNRFQIRKRGSIWCPHALGIGDQGSCNRSCILVCSNKEASTPCCIKATGMFGVIGFPKIFHTDNGKEFTAKVFLKFLRQINPKIIAVTGWPYCPSEQGLIEGMNKLVKRVIGSKLTEWRLVLDRSVRFGCHSHLISAWTLKGWRIILWGCLWSTCRPWRFVF